jgi:hypothetical protein
MQMLLTIPVQLHAPMLLPHPRQHGVAGGDAGERIGMSEEIPQLLDQRLQAPVEAADAFGERLIFRGLDRPAPVHRIAQRPSQRVQLPVLLERESVIGVAAYELVRLVGEPAAELRGQVALRFEVDTGRRRPADQRAVDALNPRAVRPQRRRELANDPFRFVGAERRGRALLRRNTCLSGGHSDSRSRARSLRLARS